MYRTNAQSRLLEEAFLTANLPYKLVGAQRFYGRREVKDLIAYLRLIHNPNDELSLTRIINTPTRGIGDKTFLTLRTQAQKANLSPGEMVLNFSHGKSPALQEQLSGRSGAALANFGSMLSNWINFRNDVPPLNLMDRILTDTDYRAYIDDGTDTGQDRWDNIMEMRRLAAEFDEAGLEAFLEQVALVSDQDTVESGTGSGATNETKIEAPTLLTLHAAKGLEFPVVFLTGLNDGTLPHSRSFEDPEAMMEERRLFYVGITRSKDLLFLVYSQNRTSYGFSEPADPSRFLADIPASMLQDTTIRSRIGNTHPLSSSQAERQAPNRPDRWQVGNASTSPGSSPPVKQRFSPGIQVIHPNFGEGMVLSSRIQDDDEILDIFFANVGLKRLAASLARLEIKG
jgi:DNA helicase-2/ATP-dependent DNA helicase PcrA